MTSELRDAFAILKQDKYKTAQVAGRQSATNFGIIFLAVPPVFNLFLSSLSYPSGFGAIFTRFVFWTMMIPAISLVGAIFTVSLVGGKFFRPGVSHMKVFRVLSYASVILWLTVLSFLFDLLGVPLGPGLYNIFWFVGLGVIFFVAFRFLTEEYKFIPKNAVISIAVAVLAYLVLNYLLGASLIGVGYRILY